jgi:hypothetical protein
MTKNILEGNRTKKMTGTRAWYSPISSSRASEYFGRQQNEEDDGYQGVVQPNIKFASLKGKSPFYGDILDDDPIDCHDVCYAARTNGS